MGIRCETGGASYDPKAAVSHRDLTRLATLRWQMQGAEEERDIFLADAKRHKANFGWLERHCPTFCSWFHIGNWERVNRARWNAFQAKSMQNHVDFYREQIRQL